MTRYLAAWTLLRTLLGEDLAAASRPLIAALRRGETFKAAMGISKTEHTISAAEVVEEEE